MLSYVSDVCLYSATAKQQHFNCLGQVLRQNCLRYFQTFQIFVSSTTPTLFGIETTNQDLQTLLYFR